MTISPIKAAPSDPATSELPATFEGRVKLLKRLLKELKAKDGLDGVVYTTEGGLELSRRQTLNYSVDED